jgi:hypothetical protein
VLDVGKLVVKEVIEESGLADVISEVMVDDSVKVEGAVLKELVLLVVIEIALVEKVVGILDVLLVTVDAVAGVEIVVVVADTGVTVN